MTLKEISFTTPTFNEMATYHWLSNQSLSGRCLLVVAHTYIYTRLQTPGVVPVSITNTASTPQLGSFSLSFLSST